LTHYLVCFNFERRPILITAFLMAAALAACHRGSSDQTAYMRSIHLPSPAPSLAAWPTYVATDYDKRGHPALTKKQAALIRYTLSLLKPCQAALLRYAFPNNFPGMVLFFQPSDPSTWPYVLWTKHLGYKPTEGEAFPMPDADWPIPKWKGTAYEVVHQSCHPSDLAATPPPR
jgi:hypothetical protein